MLATHSTFRSAGYSAFLVLQLALLAICACRPQSRDEHSNHNEIDKETATPSPWFNYYLARESPECRVISIVNGQPAYEWIGSFTGITGISHFIVDGQNTIVLTLTRDTDTPLAYECVAKVLVERESKGEWDHQVLGEIVIEAGSKEREKTTTFEFASNMPAHWRWQDSQKVVSLTHKDREEIMKIVETLGDSYKRGDLERIQQISSTWWTNEEPDGYVVRSDGHGDEQLKQVIAQPGTKVLIADKDEISISIGSRLVRASVNKLTRSFAGFKPKPIIGVYGRHDDPDTVPFEFEVTELYFCREDGGWRLLY